MAVASLAVRLSAQIAEFQSAFKDTSKTINKFASDFEGIATRASAVGTFIGNIATDIAKSLASGLGQAAKDAVRLSSEFSNAFTGLSSVSRAFGTDAGLAREAAKALAQDGLLPVKDAASGLKNLLAAGFSLPEATKLMNAFKDSAAFGRQGALSFGDAIRQATEGVKNGNSILVDNAGITKNLSVILKEAGFSAQDLGQASSNAGVRQALFNGILKEAAAFAGDAQKATETYSGQVIRLGTAYDTFLASVGDAVTQNLSVARALGFVSEQLSGLTANLSGNRQGFNLVSEAVIVLVKALSAVLNVVDLVQTGFAGLQQFVNRAGIAMANFGITYLAVAEKANSAMRFLDPMNYDRYATAVREAKEATTFLEGAVKGFGEASKDAQARSSAFGNGLQGARASLTTLSGELEATRGKTIEFGASGKMAGDTFAAGMKATATVTKEALKEATKAHEAFLESVRKQAVEAVRVQQMTAMMRGLTDAVKAQRVELQLLYIPAVNDWASANQATTATLLEMVTTGRVFKNEFPDVFKKLSEDAAQANTQLVSLGDSISNAFARIPSILADAFTGGGGLAGGLKAIGITIADSILVPLTQGLKKIQVAAVSTGSAMAAALGGAAGGGTVGQVAGIAASLGGAALAASAWGTSMTAAGVAGTVALGAATLGIGAAAVGAAILIKKLTDSKGRDAIKRFAEDNGGFDALRTKMNDLGAEGEQLWVDLTQKVGKGNLTQAQSAIAAIEAALEAHKSKAAEAAADAESSQQRMAGSIDAATAGIRSRIADLGTEFDSLFKSIENEAPEEVMGIIESNARARMAQIASERNGLEAEMSRVTDAVKDNLGGLGDAAGIASRDIEARLNEIHPDPIRMTIEIPGFTSEIQGLSQGGIVRRPTLALIGEAGPEAVIPLGAGASFGGGQTPVNLYLDGELVATNTTKHQGQMLRSRVKVGV